MSKSNDNFLSFDGIGGGTGRSTSLPIQTLPMSKKKTPWQKATMQALYDEAIRQRNKNYIFADIRRMTQGEFTYTAVDLEQTFTESPWVERHAEKLKKDSYIPSHIKHFDFIGIIANAITGIYDGLEDKYRVVSEDEYMTNEYIRERTRGLEKYAEAIFKAEIDRMLLSEGINPDQTQFNSEEEKQQYLQQLDAKVKQYTPQEIEANLSKNFKVLATEWATNVLRADKERFKLGKEDRKSLLDYILTGRWFRHYKVGYDYYDIEYWRPEEVFFSQDIDCEYPQDLDYVGRLTRMSISQVLDRYGHLMNQTQQERIGNYFNQQKDYKNNFGTNTSSTRVEDAAFSQVVQTPFPNYFDHEINLQMEQALGVPLARKMDDEGNITKAYLPRMENDFVSNSSASFTQYLRDDIDVRLDSIETMDVYWRSQKMFGVLISETETGELTVDVTTEELLEEVLEQREIKKIKISLQELNTALSNQELQEYKNTISYHYCPEIWHGILIKGNTSKIKEDLLLDVKPLEYQIKGDSNLFKVRIPVGGLIKNGLVPKVLPYQQLHNICMNQISDLLAKESRLGTFYTMDINSLPAQYKDKTTEETIEEVGDSIQDTGIVLLDPSRANTQGSTVYPNLFQKNEVVFANQIQYRQVLAEFYKQQGYAQVGITPQMLGQPNKYETAEGVKQNAEATYALMNSLIEDFNTSKSVANELHIAIAQYCETNGKEVGKITRKPDHLLSFINILAEDKELFPLRRLSVIPATDSKDRAIVKAIQQILMNDNTFSKSFEDIVEVMSNPYVLELREIGRKMRQRDDLRTEQDRQFQSEQLDKQIESEQKALQDDREHELLLKTIDAETDIEIKRMDGIARISDRNGNLEAYDRLESAYKDTLDDEYRNSQLDLENQDFQRKKAMDLEARKKNLEDLKLKKEQIKLKYKELEVKEKVALVNKN